jgi:TolB protein
VLTGTQLAGTSYQTSPRGLRRVGHQISDEIYQRLTGEKGYFDSRIVYVAESGSTRRRVKRLAIMDQDGFNHQYITGGKSLVLTPRFTANEQKIIYMSYANGNPRVRTLDIETGRETVVGNFPGMTFSPHYSPNGKNLLISVANKGNTDKPYY